MEKRGVFFTYCTFFLLVLIPNAFSIYGENIYSGTVEDGDIINITDKEFEFKIDPVSKKVYIGINVSGIILNSGECKIKDGLNICITNVSWSYRNYDPWYDVYKTLLTVYQIKSGLDIIHTMEKNNLLIDEETTAELSFENTADIVAEDVTATVNIPSSLLVVDTEGCEQSFGNILFEEDVHPKQIRKCTYKIKGLNAGDFELKADVSYFDKVETVNKTSNTISGEVYDYALKIKPKLNKSRLDIGEELNLTIEIENTNEQYDLTMTSFNIKLPEKLLLLKRPQGTTGTNKIISWSGTLQSEESKNFTLQAQSLITSNYAILTKANYKIDKFSRQTEESTDVEVYCDCPFIEHEFSQGIVVPQQRAVLKANLINPSSINSFKNVKLSYVTDVPGIQDYSTVYGKIHPTERIKIFDSSVISPDLGKAYYLNVTVKYESSGGQVFVVRENIPIKVPDKKEEIVVEEESEVNVTGEVEEKAEAEEQQDVSLEVEEPGSTIEETEGEKEEQADEEIPLSTLDNGEKSSFMIYAIITFVLALTFIFVLVTIFKRRKEPEVQGETLDDIGEAIDELEKE
ncbi:hypothetical protein CMO93_05030 [Candidatus Woesearchaeota archaeon]|nr:hypothetical protein [Candidatus Woesearchaeota archaeon]|tara:strand:- start:518 stop:2236 length:1719 start_codon:yes stop_codon:yes gene_type:complete